MKLTALIAGAAVAALFASGASAAQMTLKFGHVGEPGSLFQVTVDHFAKCANGKLGDKAKVETYGSSQLGNDQELLQKLLLGQVDFSLPSSVMSSVDDTFGIFEMPYIIKNRDQMRRVWKQMKPIFEKAAERHGYYIVGLMENGFRQITNNVRPIYKPDDLKGIKLRTPKGAWRVKMFKLYGANPTPMAFSDVFTALKTGVIDGQENPLAQIVSAHFQEVQKYLSLTDHVYTPAYILASKKHFDALPGDVKQALEACGNDAQDFAYKTAAQMDKDLLQKVKDAGVKVNKADKQAFIDASGPIYKEFAKEVDGGQKLINQVQSLASGT